MSLAVYIWLTWEKAIWDCHPYIHHHSINELDDGKILTGKPKQFDGKIYGFL